MKKEILKRMGITNFLLDKYQNEEKIRIFNEEVQFLNEELFVDVFLDVFIKDKILGQEMANESVSEKVFNYIMFFRNLYERNIDEARDYLKKIKMSNQLPKYERIVAVYDFILNNKDEDFSIRYEDNEILHEAIALFKKYMSMQQFKIAADILSEILTVEPNPEFLILFEVLQAVSDKTNYIVDTWRICDNVTREGIRRLERKLLINLEMNNLKAADSILRILCKISLESYEVVRDILYDAKKFNYDYTCICKRDLFSIVGTFDQVVEILVKNDDYYRVRDMINSKIIQEPTDLKLQIIKIMVDRIIILNDRNNKYLKESIKTLSEEQVIREVKNFPFSSLKREDIVDDGVIKVDTSKNYYAIYESYYKSRDYIKAKQALKQFEVNMRAMDIRKDVGYLLAELDILIANEDTIEESAKLIEQAKMCKGFAAIELYEKAIRIGKYVNPRILVSIALEYMHLGDYKKALEYYLEAEKIFLYPEDYITIMELLLELHQDKMVNDYYIKYEYYYPEENAYVYYLWSISLANLGLFDEAIEALNMADMINVEYNNVLYYHEDEHDILTDLQNGEEVKMYDRHSFISWDLTDAEKVIQGNIKRIMKEGNVSILEFVNHELAKTYQVEDKVAYLLSVIKIFNYEENRDDENIIIRYLDNFLKNVSVQEEVLKDAVKRLKVYREDWKC